MANTSSPSVSPRVAVDAVIFTVQRGELQVLLIQMKKRPFENQWAFPGGIIEDQEPTEHAAKRILHTQAGVRDVYLEQLMTFDDPRRDPLGRVISVAYYALVPNEGIHLQTTDRYKDVRWWSVKKLPSLAYDHAHIAHIALQRLRSKLEYTNVAWSLLSEEFTLTELQALYESILGRALDKRNFRKKIQSLGIVKETGKLRKGATNRPAMLYTFKQRKPVIIKLF
jgi:8-oxo-dGTP diphosphatase